MCDAARMGLMPPYDPLSDDSLRWAVVDVRACRPAAPTWATPAAVEFAVVRAIRGELPSSLVAWFDAPREAAESRFYAVRDATPELAAKQLADLDRTPIEVPASGARILVWLAAPTPPNAVPPAPPGPPGSPSSATTRPADCWTIPTSRLSAPGDPPMRSRWIEHSAKAESWLRARLGVR